MNINDLEDIKQELLKRDILYYEGGCWTQYGGGKYIWEPYNNNLRHPDFYKTIYERRIPSKDKDLDLEWFEDWNNFPRDKLYKFIVGLKRRQTILESVPPDIIEHLYYNQKYSIKKLSLFFKVSVNRIKEYFLYWNIEIKSRKKLSKEIWENHPEKMQETLKEMKKGLFEFNLKKVNDSIYAFDSNGVIIGWKKDRFDKKYPEFTWDIYKEPKWKEKSLEILENNKWMCEGCGEEASEVHHKKNFYNNPQIALKDDNLVALCHKCHEIISKTRKEYAKKNYKM